MSKIICDVCGTSYPETATHCPICGCVRPGNARVVLGDTNEPEVHSGGNYTYVKGGRFSKANVNKRSVTAQQKPADSAVQKPEAAKQEKKSEAGLLIAVIVLLLAIVAVVVYIAMRFFAPNIPAGDIDNTSNSSSQIAESSSETTETTVLEIPCTDLTVSKSVIEFEKADAALLLNVTVLPEDTTDTVVFASTDEKVAIVNQEGKITAVGPGQAVITITCGQAAAECRIVCNFESKDPEPTTDSKEPTTDKNEPSGSDGFDPSTLKLNWYYAYPGDPQVGDVTLNKGDKWTAYLDGEGKVKSTQILFTTSDPSVIVIDNTGVATAVGVGEAYVYAEYNGHKVKCRVMVV